jgi:hypothetical protein
MSVCPPTASNASFTGKSSVRHRRQRPVVLHRAAQLEELGVGGPAAERLRIADLPFDRRDDFRERDGFCPWTADASTLIFQ